MEKKKQRKKQTSKGVCSVRLQCKRDWSQLHCCKWTETYKSWAESLKRHNVEHKRQFCYSLWNVVGLFVFAKWCLLKSLESLRANGVFFLICIPDGLLK